MYKSSINSLFLFSFFVIIIISCRKEISCEDCKENEPPIAIAGPDQVITLPTDSVSLNGSASSDPDGTISEWLWTKISGPAFFNIASSSTAETAVKNLGKGIYKFELKVTDNKGISGKDTIQITVNDPDQPNQPPVANAGSDQVITLPVNKITLDGSASTDPDNNIVNYVWTKITGQSSSINNPNTMQTQVTNLIQGFYQFELKVTDSGGLFSWDTMNVTVNPTSPTPAPCDNSNRPVINAHLIPFGTLSQRRLGMSVASAGNKIVFAGASLSALSGSPYPEYGSLRVDIYDLVTQSWTTAELSEKRSDIAAVAAGNKIFFAGGRLGDGAFDGLFSTVDIYDVSSNSWSVANLSEPRAYIAAAAVGNKVFFAGGEKDWDYNTSDKVDIYDLSTNVWSTANLSEPRAHISAVTVNNKVYFAGGHKEDRWYADPSNKIDIYDNSSNTWSTSTLNQPKSGLAAITVSEKIYWAAGCNVEIRDVNTGNTSIDNLFQPGGWSIVKGQNAVLKDGNIIFFRHDYLIGSDKFDIYNIASDTWSIGVLPQRVYGPSIISVNNSVYLAGGTVSGSFGNLSDQVWKLEF